MLHNPRGLPSRCALVHVALPSRASTVVTLWVQGHARPTVRVVMDPDPPLLTLTAVGVCLGLMAEFHKAVMLGAATVA